jgi:RimJ/RimL family protein N-acetyltransferase
MRNSRQQKNFSQKRKSNLYFSPNFRLDFNWKTKHPLRVGSVLPVNALQIANGLKDMSPESIRNRFLGSKKEFSQKELEYLTHLDGLNHYAIGIEEQDRPHRGVAIVRLVRSSEDPKQAEIAISMIDEYQKMGLGVFLLNLITLAAIERKIERLSFTFLPQNEGIIRLINKMGVPVVGPHTKDYVELFLDLSKRDVTKIKSELAAALPDITNFA